MKYLAGVYTLITIFAIALLPHAAFADSSHSEVNVQSNTGGNTICQNGNCKTTSGGNGQSTVCINGNCQTSDGNIDMQSDDGHDQVHISNDSSNVSPTITPSPTDTPVSISPEPSLSPVPSMTPDPTIAEMRKQVRKQIREQIKQLKEHVKDQDAALSTLVQSFQNLLGGLFK